MKKKQTTTNKPKKSIGKPVGAFLREIREKMAEERKVRAMENLAKAMQAKPATKPQAASEPATKPESKRGRRPKYEGVDFRAMRKSFEGYLKNGCSTNKYAWSKVATEYEFPSGGAAEKYVKRREPK